MAAIARKAVRFDRYLCVGCIYKGLGRGYLNITNIRLDLSPYDYLLKYLMIFDRVLIAVRIIPKPEDDIVCHDYEELVDSHLIFFILLDMRQDDVGDPVADLVIVMVRYIR